MKLHMQLMKANGKRTCSYADFAHSICRFFSGRKGLEQRTYQDDERIATLEQQLAEAQLIAEDSDRKYDEVMNVIEYMSIKLISPR